MELVRLLQNCGGGERGGERRRDKRGGEV